MKTLRSASFLILGSTARTVGRKFFLPAARHLITKHEEPGAKNGLPRFTNGLRRIRPKRTRMENRQCFGFSRAFTRRIRLRCTQGLACPISAKKAANQAPDPGRACATDSFQSIESGKNGKKRHNGFDRPYGKNVAGARNIKDGACAGHGLRRKDLWPIPAKIPLRNHPNGGNI